MFNQVEYQLGGDADKPVNRVVNYFLFIQCVAIMMCKNVK